MGEAGHPEFIVLENKTIGRNLYVFRKLRDRKALEVAGFLGMKEAAYTKYERGESKITVELIQKISEFLSVDPLHLISAQPNYVIEHLINSPASNNSGNNHTIIHDQQTQVMMEMLETMRRMSEAIRKILDGK